MQKEVDARRKFGIELVGNIPWGTHLCQFYETKQDLVDILVPYFAEGLRSNEFCMWVTSPPLEVEEAKKALGEVVPDLDSFITKGQIEILSYDDWYLHEGNFDSGRVLQGWVDKEKAALEHGFEGLRLTGNTFWVARDLWTSFVNYEESINSVIGEHRMIAVCTYCLLSCSGTDVLDVVRNHIGTLVKQGKKWTLVENAIRRKLVNGALKLSEHKFSALFENMQDAFAYHRMLFDDKGAPMDYVFLEANEAFEKFTGLKRESIIGKKVTEVFPGFEKDPNDLIGIYGRVAKTGEALKFEMYFEPLKRWYSISAYSPEMGYFVATFEDISGRKNAEKALRESEQRWATTLSSIGDAVIATDVDGKITFMNSVAENLTGWTLAESSQKLVKDVFKIANKQTHKEVENPVAKILEKGVVVGLANHTILVRKDNTKVPIDDSGAPIKSREGKTTGVVLVFRDISEREQMVAKLEEYSKHLEGLVEARTKQLKDAERLAAIGQTAGMVGHDIRNPLQAIVGELYLAKDDVASLAESSAKENLKETIGAIEENIGYINKIVSDLQDFAKPLNPMLEESNLEGIIHDLLLHNELPANIRVTSEVCSDAKIVMADSAYLKRILGNLVSNAVQAMPNGGKLTVDVSREVDDIVISVKDSGVGVPEDVRFRLFQPLFTTKSKGQGFGLAVVKRMVEALNGSVTFESEVDKGTKFIVRFPSRRHTK